MGRKAKTLQLQIRVSPAEKFALAQAARHSGQSLSAYVLAKALPPRRPRFIELVQALREAGEAGGGRHVLAELNDLLAGLSAHELAATVGERIPAELSPWLENYVAAMVEQAVARQGVPPPDWLRDVPPLAEPYFATPLVGLRLHLLRASPVAYRRRNLFVDSGVGDRV